MRRLTLLALLSLSLTACANESSQASLLQEQARIERLQKTTAENIGTVPGFSGFRDLLALTEQEEVATGTKRYTILVPTNAALIRLPRNLDFVDLLKPENKAAATALVKGHLLEGDYHLEDLETGDVLTTINGIKLRVNRYGGLVVLNDAITLGDHEIPSKNGTILIAEAPILAAVQPPPR
jgi:uncharacterized surface protein with fasciclin (FAS1) repeats